MAVPCRWMLAVMLCGIALHVSPVIAQDETSPTTPPGPRAAVVRLATASMPDEATPDDALTRSAGDHATQRAEAHGEHRYPLALALAGALAQVAIIVAAIGFGLSAVKSRV